MDKDKDTRGRGNGSAHERTSWMNGERKLAMFIDFENIARGVKEAQYKAFEIKLVLERLLEKGKIISRRAYADWNRFTEYKRPFHEWAIELIDVPQSRSEERRVGKECRSRRCPDHWR